MKIFSEAEWHFHNGVPHLLQLIQQTSLIIYHDIFLFFIPILGEIFAAHGTLFDVEEIPTHGGSLRI